MDFKKYKISPVALYISMLLHVKKHKIYAIQYRKRKFKKHKRGKSIAIDIVKELIRAIFIAFLSIRYNYYT